MKRRFIIANVLVLFLLLIVGGGAITLYKLRHGIALEIMDEDSLIDQMVIVFIVSAVVATMAFVGVLMAYILRYITKKDNELFESNKKYRRLFEALPEAIVIHRDETVQYANQAAAALFGVHVIQDLLGNSMGELIFSDEIRDGSDMGELGELRELRVQAQGLGETGKVTGTKQNVNKLLRMSGEVIIVEMSSTEIDYEGQLSRLTIIRDITSRKLAEQKLLEANDTLKRLSVLDGLTGVYNRRAFSQMLHDEWNDAISSGRELSIIMFDVDFFKEFNDTYGHPAGDACLIKVTETLKPWIQQYHGTLSRYGGEEFAVILSDQTYLSAFQIAKGINEQVSSLNIPHVHSGVAAGKVTVSVGLAMSKGRGCGTCNSPEELIKRADRALYRAKEQGRNQVRSYCEPQTQTVQCAQ